MAEDLKLPTEDDLEQLYLEKGKKAVIWFAWRCALRALSTLGVKPLESIWYEDTVKYGCSVVRVSLFLSVINESNNVDGGSVATAAARAASARAAIDAYVARAAAYVDAADTTAAYVDAADTAARAAYAYAYAYAYAADTAAAYAYAATAARTTIAQTKLAIINDYQWLLKQDHFEWQILPLWDNKPTIVDEWESNLLENLRELKLDFLANDLKKVWEGKPIGKHAKNYLKDLSESITNDPIALRRAILGEATEQIQAVRVLLLGSGGAGKSSLADRLQANPIKQIKPSTQGIDYLNHQSLKLEEKHPSLKLKTNDLDLYLWDFGGQTIFHGLHSAFLHENCVYVLVVDSRHEQAPDEWLHQIRHLAGNQANVLLITNEYENCKTQQNQKRLLREFPDLLNQESFFYFSCLTPEPSAFKAFLEKLIQVSSESRRAIFKSTLEIRDELSTRYQSEVFLNLDEVEEIIADKVEVAEYRPSTLTQLEQLGFIIPTQGEKYCLNPVWVVDNAYKVLYSEKVRNNHGIIGLNAIRKLLNCTDKYQAEILVRDLLQERALCCAISKTEYFFPDAASTNEPNEATQVLEHPVLTLRFDVPYLPLGFHARLVHKLYQPTQPVSIQNTQDIWRQGFILKVLEQNKAKAVVHYLHRKSAIEMVFNGEVEYFAPLLETFYPKLEEALDTSAAQQKIKIQTFVSDGLDKLVSISSVDNLVQILKKAEHIDDANEGLAKIKAERRQRLLDKLSEIYKQYDFETRKTEKLRLKI